MSDDGAGGTAGVPRGSSPGASTERQVPFFCPYCGDESLRPSGPDAGGWTCGSCARSFKLSFAGLAGSGTGQ
jgi:ribosomal protein L37AE/L43A